MKTAALVRSFFCIVGISLLALQFAAPVPAHADPDDMTNYDEYIKGIHNYIGTCNRDVARQASPVSLLTSGISSSFKPLFIIQAWDDPVCPSRQVADMESALIDAGVGACKYQIALVPHDDQYHDVHGLRLWQAPDPNHPSEKIGKSVLLFLHQNLDN
jgi:hypothetical protein